MVKMKNEKLNTRKSLIPLMTKNVLNEIQEEADMNEIDKRIRRMRKGMTAAQFKEMHECWAIGSQIKKIRLIAAELHQRVSQRTQGRASVWWALSTNDYDGVPTYMALWARRHTPGNNDGQLHKQVRFLFHGPISVAEERVPELADYVVNKLKW